MRTNIEIDDELMAEALDASGLTTKRAVVEEALRTLIRIRAGQALRDLRGQVTWTGDLEAWRTDVTR
jgi:Arc/MetJ family transcription regulator